MGKGSQVPGIAAAKYGMTAVWGSWFKGRPKLSDCCGYFSVQTMTGKEKIHQLSSPDAGPPAAPIVAWKSSVPEFADREEAWMRVKCPVTFEHVKRGVVFSEISQGHRWCSGSSWRSASMADLDEHIDDTAEMEADADFDSPSELIPDYDGMYDDLRRAAAANVSSSVKLMRNSTGKYDNLMQAVKECEKEILAWESDQERMGPGGVPLSGPFEFVKIPSRSWALVDDCDKLVAKAAAMTLNRIYEPLYSDYSHAFRSSRGCHSVMMQIKKKWRGIDFFLKFDIKKCYYQINREKLQCILQEEIQDEQFVDLVMKFFQTEVQLCRELKDPPPERGLPRGSIILKSLCNLYLNKLDQEVSRIRKDFEYTPVLQREEKREEVDDEDEGEEYDSSSETDGEQRSSGEEVRIRYLRYADEFLLGFTGPKPLLKEIQQKILTYLKTDLHLDSEIDHLVHVTSGHVRFLGMRIAGLPESKRIRKYAKGMEKRRRVKARYRQFAKQKQESWDIQLNNLILLAWSRAFKKVRSTVASCVDFEQVLQKKANEMVSNFEIEKLENGDSNETIRQLLEREQMEMMKLSVLVIPDEIVEAHKNLTEAMQDFLHQEDKEEKGLLDSASPQVRKGLRAGRREKFQDAVALQILAPMEEVTDKLKKRGILTTKQTRPNSLGSMKVLPDEEIVAYFASVAYGLHTYYRCCDNLTKIRRLLDYQVRWSAIFTLASKHKCSAKLIRQKYTRDLHVVEDGKIIAKFPTTIELTQNMGKRFLPDIYEEVVDEFLR